MPDMQRCVELCETCADECDRAIQALARGSNEHCGACAEACDQCAQACEKFREQACLECAAAARRCESACRNAVALGFINPKYSIK